MSFLQSFLSILRFFTVNQDETKTQEISERFDKAFETAKEISKSCQVSSLNIGVLHEGKVIFRKSIGFTDCKTGKAVDSKSLYTLCSVTKTFVSIAFGILVEQGKIKWTDTVSQYLPEFKPQDHRVADEANFNDIFRHSAGLENPVVSLLGPDGKVFVTKERFLEVLNNTPTQQHGEPLFQSWNYSNVGYGLIVLAIEEVSGKPFSEFLQEEVLNPLKMKHTAVSIPQLDSTDNIAHPHAQMEDESWVKLEHDWTDEKNSPVLGMVGIRSSVDDMLKYSAAIMDAYLRRIGHSNEDGSSTKFEILSDLENENPIKQIGAILNGYYWSRPHYDPFDHQVQYHLGWVKVPMPSCMVNWGSWNETLADHVPEEGRRARDALILGQDPPEKRLLFKSSGIGFCGTSSVNLFPETQSAVVVFSSGLNRGDASDFVASIFIQELFDLKPRIDLKPAVRSEIEFRDRQFKKILQDLKDNEDLSEPESDHNDYIGEYSGLGITLLIQEAPDGQGMEVRFNRREDTAQPLKHYGKEKYSYWPSSRDEWLKGGWLDWDYYLVGIFEFQRSNDEVTELTWVWEEGAEPFPFKKKAKKGSTSL